MRLLDGAGVPPSVVVGSISPAKSRAVTQALLSIYGFPVPISSVAAASGVPSQPWGDQQTRAGATNRAEAALRLLPTASLAVGIEAGAQQEADGPTWTFAWVVALDRDGVKGAARSATFALPDLLAEGVRGGAELGDALDAAYGLKRAKEDQGTVGVLTRGLLDRAGLYAPAVLLALTPWL